MKPLKSHLQIERLHCLKNRASQSKNTTLALAVICLTSGLALPGYSQTQATDRRWILTGSLKTNRYAHTATLLSDGKVLVVGGGGFPCTGNFCYSTVNSSAELYDPANKRWSYTGSLNNRRTGHSATLLQNGQVLVAGGSNFGFDIGIFFYESSAELCDPVTGQWRLTGSFNAIQAYNSTTLLQNGEVLAVGSSNLDTKHVVNNAELYDPATGKWSITASPSIAAKWTMLLSNGKVLAVSGNSSELYDPDSGTWSGAGNLNSIRSAMSATLLQNGKVLVTGAGETESILSAELFDPETGVWSITGSPHQVGGRATLLGDGRVLVAGGFDNSQYVSVPNADLYDPATGNWSIAGNLNTARSGHTVTLLNDGNVLAVGGMDGDGDIGTKFLESAELYGPIVTPKIISASVSGKHLIILGENLEPGAVILLNGEAQKTKHDGQNPETTLIGKKVGKKIKPGDKLQVRNPDGTLSQEFVFTGS